MCIVLGDPAFVVGEEDGAFNAANGEMSGASSGILLPLLERWTPRIEVADPPVTWLFRVECGVRRRGLR